MADTPTMLALANRRGPIQFIVEIHYREPNYETCHGARDEPFPFRYRIHSTAECARWLALDEVRRITELSSVGWICGVVRVDVIPVIPMIGPGRRRSRGPRCRKLLTAGRRYPM